MSQIWSCLVGTIFSLHYFLKRSRFLPPLTFWVSQLKSVCFPSGCFPPYCIPSVISLVRTELIYRPESSPGLGRKIARRQINEPLSIAQENASTGVRLWRSGNWKNLHLSPMCDCAEREHTQLVPTPGAWDREKRFGMALAIYSNYCFSFIIKATWRTWGSSQIKAERGEGTKGFPRESVLPNLPWIQVSR